MKEVRYIYELIDPRTDETRYIGKAKNPVRRFRAHLNDLLFINPHKHNWIKELKGLGLIPILNIIDVANKQDIDFLEVFYINLYKSWGLNLTNIKPGGTGGSSQGVLKHSLKSRERMRFVRTPEGKKWLEEQRKLKEEKSKLGKTVHMNTSVAREKAVKTKKRKALERGYWFTEDHKEKISKGLKNSNHPLHGNHHSEKTKLKISLNRKGITAWNKGKPNPDRAQAILVYDLNNNLIQEFTTTVKARKHFKVGCGTIERHCKKNRIFKENYFLKYKIND